jgi:cytochrome c biogenesis protein CcmG, thiol:disulfide interchange protein DsbE
MSKLVWLSVAVVVSMGACRGGRVNLNTGSVAPAFEASRVDGELVRFPDDFRGQAVVVRFWAAWCSHCRGEMLAIERVRQRRPGLVVLAVNSGQDRRSVAAFVAETHVGYPTLVDEAAEVTRAYGVTGLPTTFFVGRDGVIEAKVVGEADEATFERLAAGL